VLALHRSIGRYAAIVLAALVLVLAFGSAQPAAAQGKQSKQAKPSKQSVLNSAFRGALQRRAQPPPRASSYAASYVAPERGERRSASGPTSGSTGRGAAFCVRTCDGRYFPLQRHAGLSPAEACRSLCPAAKTLVFSGSKIESAVAPNGVRYAQLDSAFAYRKKVVPDCTCNGKDGGGLARMETTGDPTLRPGDIVATTGGLAVHGKARSAELTPINPSSGEWARRLSEIKVRPAPPEEKVEIKAPAGDDAKPNPRKRDAKRSPPKPPAKRIAPSPRPQVTAKTRLPRPQATAKTRLPRPQATAKTRLPRPQMTAKR
jgi:hypothetical protein